jgi:glycine amidinotransferase
LTKTVSSYNEWDPLEEVIVGSAEGFRYPGWQDVLTGGLPASSWPVLRDRASLPFSPDLLASAARELDSLCAVLEREGVTVRRPAAQDHSRPFSTPTWSVSSGLGAAMPRDLVLIAGEEIIETAPAWRARHFETFAYRDLFQNYFVAGARWSAMPKPVLSDNSYEQRPALIDGAQTVVTQAAEREPTLDAADCLRCGSDIFVQRSSVTNRLGLQWLRRHLGPTFRVHEISFDDAQPMHVDSTFLPISPGKALANPERVRRIPPAFRGWEIRYAPPPEGYRSHPMHLSSRWISMNILMINPETAVVDAEQTALRTLLKDWGIATIPLPFQHFGTLGGSFHCATLDIRRNGSIDNYF